MRRRRAADLRLHRPVPQSAQSGPSDEQEQERYELCAADVGASELQRGASGVEVEGERTLCLTRKRDVS